MPQTHERTFRVRHSECDAYGFLSHACYLRYMQEAAMDASAALGYDLDRYNEMGSYWLIRETDITFVRPLTYGDSVIVKTWVADFRRVRSRRAYEFRHAQTGAPVARAFTDWVYLDTATQQPVTVPAEMIAAFYPEGWTGQAPRRAPFPADETPPPGIFTGRQRAEWRDLDAAQHVNNATYLAYIENVTAQAWPVMPLMNAGIRPAIRRYRIEHKQPALLGDNLEIVTWVSGVKAASAARHYTVSRDGTPLARAYVVWVGIDLASGRPVRFSAWNAPG